MPRKLKPQQVGECKHQQTGISVPIMFDRNERIFTAGFNGEVIADARYDSLHTRVYCAIRDSTRFEWLPVIEVERLTPFGGDSEDFIGFTLDRLYVASKPDGSYCAARWDCEPERRVADAQSFYWEGKFSPPCSRHRRGDVSVYYMIHSDELWTGLVKLLEVVRQARIKIDELLSSEDGNALLIKAGAGNLLTGAVLAEQPGE